MDADQKGVLTDSVRALVRASGCPNMKVLQFAIDPEDTTALADELMALTKRTGRVNWDILNG